MYEKQKVHQSPTDKFKALALAFLLVPVASFSTAAEYQLVDLGVDVTPTDINNLGTVVGARKTDSGTVAFRWLPGAHMVDIPGATVANAVNEADQVTGNTLTGAFLFDNTLRSWGDLVATVSTKRVRSSGPPGWSHNSPASTTPRCITRLFGMRLMAWST